MIPSLFIENWRKKVPWQTDEQIEQDLIISRALIDLFRDAHIKDALVFRGGTALNKLFSNPPARYSEDIDFVQKEPHPIGQTMDTIRALLNPWLGSPKWKMTQRGAKLIYTYAATNNMPSKLKIEINTTEHFHVLPHKIIPFSMDSAWFAGTTNVVTYELDELMATKLRALFQRRKGRDLFDIWYVLNHNLVNIDRILDIFSKYCRYNTLKIKGEDFFENLEQKKYHRDFHTDMSLLLPSKFQWNFEEAYQFVMHHVIHKLP